MNARVRLYVFGGPIVARENSARTGLTESVTLSCADILPVCVGGRCGGRRSLVVLTGLTAVGAGVKEDSWLKCHFSHDLSHCSQEPFWHFRHESSLPTANSQRASSRKSPFGKLPFLVESSKMTTPPLISHPFFICDALVSCQTAPPGVDCARLPQVLWISLILRSPPPRVSKQGESAWRAPLPLRPPDLPCDFVVYYWA